MLRIHLILCCGSWILTVGKLIRTQVMNISLRVTNFLHKNIFNFFSSFFGYFLLKLDKPYIELFDNLSFFNSSDLGLESKRFFICITEKKHIVWKISRHLIFCMHLDDPTFFFLSPCSPLISYSPLPTDIYFIYYTFQHRYRVSQWTWELRENCLCFKKYQNLRYYVNLNLLNKLKFKQIL